MTRHGSRPALRLAAVVSAAALGGLGCGGSSADGGPPTAQGARAPEALVRCASLAPRIAQDPGAALAVRLLSGTLEQRRAWLTTYAGPTVRLRTVDGPRPTLASGDCVVLSDGSYFLAVEHRGRWSSAAAQTGLPVYATGLGPPNADVRASRTVEGPVELRIIRPVALTVDRRRLSGVLPDAARP